MSLFFFKVECSFKAGIHYFCHDFQSGEVDISCQKSKSICIFEFTDFIYNFEVYNGHRLRLF